jgi:hypothetical protein
MEIRRDDNARRVGSGSGGSLGVAGQAGNSFFV